MTPKQRTAFFKLFNDAWAVSGTGRDKDAWRKTEMANAIPGLTTTKAIRDSADFDTLMRHFAVLAQDADACAYYAAAEERRHRHILRAVEADLAFLRNEGFNEAYMVAIYHQTGAPSYNTIDDIPAKHLHLIVQIADSYVRKLRRAADLEPWQLPSAGKPWCIRGVRAAKLAAQFAPRCAQTSAPVG
jgi:hypothetical protein